MPELIRAAQELEWQYARGAMFTLLVSEATLLNYAVRMAVPWCCADCRRPYRPRLSHWRWVAVTSSWYDAVHNAQPIELAPRV